MAQINLYFHDASLSAPLRSTRTHLFWNYFSDQCPYKISVNTFENYKDLELISNNEVNVVFIPMNKPYFRNMVKTEFGWLESCYRFDDLNTKNVLVLDYSNETELPGTFGPTESWHQDINIQFERFFLTTMALELFNHNIRMPVAGIFPDWNFVATVIYDSYYKPARLKDHERSTVVTYEGKTADKKFIFPNRVARKHRLDFIIDMHNLGLLGESHWSLIYPTSTEADVQRDYDFDHMYFKLFGKQTKYMEEPLREWSALGLRGSSTGDLLPFDADQYLAYVCVDTYADTVKRARIDLPGHHPRIIDISEKVAKGFAQGIPCFYYSSYGSLNWLKNNGFWFPGNYSDTPDDDQRRADVINSMFEFEDVISKATLDGVMHNRNLILNKKFLYSKCSKLIDHIYTKFCA